MNAMKKNYIKPQISFCIAMPCMPIATSSIGIASDDDCKNVKNNGYLDEEDNLWVSGNLVGISINLCKSIQKELFINDTP